MRCLGLVTLLLLTVPDAARSTTIPAAGLQADFVILRRAYESLHPGLYRYNTPAEMDRRFTELRAKLGRDMTRREAYLAFAEFLASIRCGHTYANFWNQSDEVQDELFHGADKVPFAFRIVEGEMVVTKSAAANPELAPGSVIESIDEVPVASILQRLMPFLHADGSADHPRLFALQVSGAGEYEPFDVYFPLVFPPRDGRYRLGVRDPATGEKRRLTAAAMTREKRRQAFEERYGPEANSPDELWEFDLLDADTGYLKAGSFVTWKMKLDWRAFLRDAFTELRDQKVDHLIVDVRGNGGGDNDVLVTLLGYLLPRPIEVPARRELLRYEKVTADLEPYLDTWDPSFKDRTGRVEAIDRGFFTWKDAAARTHTVGGAQAAFRGRVFLLVDPANSSATFTLARLLKDTGAATLVGQPTGGNRRGINGGQMFFLRLPNSGIEMDIPLIGYYPDGDPPDRGVEPDVAVAATARQIAEGIDAVLAATRALIASP